MSNTCIIEDNLIIINGYKITLDELIKQTIYVNNITYVNVIEIIQKQCNKNKIIDDKFDEMCILLQNYDKRTIPECKKIEGIYTNIYNILQLKIQYKKLQSNYNKEINDIDTNNKIQYNIIQSKLNYQYKISILLIIIIIGQLIIFINYLNYY